MGAAVAGSRFTRNLRFFHIKECLLLDEGDKKTDT